MAYRDGNFSLWITEITEQYDVVSVIVTQYKQDFRVYTIDCAEVIVSYKEPVQQGKD